MTPPSHGPTFSQRIRGNDDRVAEYLAACASPQLSDPLSPGEVLDLAFAQCAGWEKISSIGPAAYLAAATDGSSSAGTLVVALSTLPRPGEFSLGGVSRQAQQAYDFVRQCAIDAGRELRFDIVFFAPDSGEDVTASPSTEGVRTSAMISDIDQLLRVFGFDRRLFDRARASAERAKALNGLIREGGVLHGASRALQRQAEVRRNHSLVAAVAIAAVTIAASASFFHASPTPIAVLIAVMGTVAGVAAATLAARAVGAADAQRRTGHNVGALDPIIRGHERDRRAAEDEVRTLRARSRASHTPTITSGTYR